VPWLTVMGRAATYGRGVSTVLVAPQLLEMLARAERGESAGRGSPAFLVHVHDVQTAAAAVHAASLRMINIDENGDELEPWADTGETYTPNHVSRVHVAPPGPWVTVDSQGVFYPAMVRAMIAVLVEELQRRDVDGVVDDLPRDLEGDPWEPPPSPAPPAAPDGPRAWVITRTRRRHTTTGRMWWDWEYFTNSGGWTTDSREALMFADTPPHDLVKALIADHPRSLDFGPINSTFSRVDGHETPGSKPPLELRLDD